MNFPLKKLGWLNAWLVICLFSSGCAGYKLGSTGGFQAGARSIEITPFPNQTTEPGLTEAASGLAGLLSGEGRYGEAVSLMRRTLVTRPRCEPCWIHLVVALYASGDTVAAREAAQDRVTRS